MVDRGGDGGRPGSMGKRFKGPAPEGVERVGNGTLSHGWERINSHLQVLTCVALYP